VSGRTVYSRNSEIVILWEKIDEAEVMILFIGLGNYPNECQTARSERRPADIKII